MTNPINNMTINEALKKSESAFQGTYHDNAWLPAFYWLAVVAVKCLTKIAFPKNC